MKYSILTKRNGSRHSKKLMSICCSHQDEHLTIRCLFKCPLTLKPLLMSHRSKGTLTNQRSVANSPCVEAREHPNLLSTTLSKIRMS